MKTAIVTGATSGIGRAAAIALGEAGWSVAVSGRDQSRGREVVESLEGEGCFFAADLDKPGAPDQLVDRCMEHWGRLDLLVNNAGIYSRGAVADISGDDYDRLLDVNLRAAVLLAGGAGPAKDGIRAVTVCPGTTRTPLVEEAIASAPDPAEHERVLASSRPANRLGKPEESASAIVYAASEEASFLSGTEIVVDGGYTAA